MITWAQDCGWHRRDKLSCPPEPFVESSHEDLPQKFALYVVIIVLSGSDDICKVIL